MRHKMPGGLDDLDQSAADRIIEEIRASDRRRNRLVWKWLVYISLIAGTILVMWGINATMEDARTFQRDLDRIGP